VFRAVETRTPFLSCANGGITCAIDPSGAVRASHDRVMEEGFLYARPAGRWSPPVFLRGGRWILPAALVLLCATCLLVRRTPLR
jgi:apolipoprotein N-acyltransferase